MGGAAEVHKLWQTPVTTETTETLSVTGAPQMRPSLDSEQWFERCFWSSEYSILHRGPHY